MNRDGHLPIPNLRRRKPLLLPDLAVQLLNGQLDADHPVESVDESAVHRLLAALLGDLRGGRFDLWIEIVRRALPQAELLHRSLVSLSMGESDTPCPELTGRDERRAPLTGHRHAHYLPLDLDQDGRLDHIVIHAPMGLGDEAQRALADIRRTWTKGDQRDLYVSLVGRGDRSDVSTGLLSQRGDPGLMDLSRRWQSYTPFIAPRHLKPRRHSLADQVRSELEERGFPVPLEIEVAPREVLLASGFLGYVRERRAPSKRPPSTQPWLLTLHFPEPVPGPIAIGYGCHYGLGLFRPIVVVTHPDRPKLSPR